MSKKHIASLINSNVDANFPGQVAADFSDSANERISANDGDISSEPPTDGISSPLKPKKVVGPVAAGSRKRKANEGEELEEDETAVGELKKQAKRPPVSLTSLSSSTGTSSNVAAVAVLPTSSMDVELPVQVHVPMQMLQMPMEMPMHMMPMDMPVPMSLPAPAPVPVPVPVPAPEPVPLHMDVPVYAAPHVPLMVQNLLPQQQLPPPQQHYQQQPPQQQYQPQQPLPQQLQPQYQQQPPPQLQYQQQPQLQLLQPLHQQHQQQHQHHQHQQHQHQQPLHHHQQQPQQQQQQQPQQQQHPQHHHHQQQQQPQQQHQQPQQQQQPQPQPQQQQQQQQPPQQHQLLQHQLLQPVIIDDVPAGDAAIPAIAPAVGAAAVPAPKKKAPARKAAASTVMVSGAAGNAGANGEQAAANMYRPRMDFEHYIEALKKYKELYGNMLVSRFFTVPEGTSEWPEHLQGMKLGCLLREVKRGRSHQNRREELRALGYDLECKGMGRQYMGGAPKYSYEVIKIAFIRYKELHGDMLVPVSFVVPEGTDYPPETWGIHLGRYTQEIRQGAYLKPKRDELEEIGFSFDSQRYKYGFDKVKAAYEKHKELFHKATPKWNFVVPTADQQGADQWPECLHGMTLGSMTNDIRKGKSYRKHRAEFEALGIVYYNYPEKELKKRGRKPKPSPEGEMMKEEMMDEHGIPMDDQNQPLIPLPLGLAASSSSSSSSSSHLHSFSSAAAPIIDHQLIGGSGGGSAIISSSPYLLPVVNTDHVNSNAVATQAAVALEAMGGGMMVMTNQPKVDVRTGNVDELGNVDPAAKQLKGADHGSGGIVVGSGEVAHMVVVHNADMEEQMSGVGLGVALFAGAPKNISNTPSRGAV